MYGVIIALWLEIITQIFKIWLFLEHPVRSTKKFYYQHKGRVFYYIKHPIELIFALKNSWKALISFLLAWMITNGWAYILVFTSSGLLNKLAWWYIGILYLPVTPEKVITIPLGLFIHAVLWDKDRLKNRVPRTRHGYICYIK